MVSTGDKKLGFSIDGDLYTAVNCDIDRYRPLKRVFCTNRFEHLVGGKATLESLRENCRHDGLWVGIRNQRHVELLPEWKLDSGKHTLPQRAKPLIDCL